MTNLKTTIENIKAQRGGHWVKGGKVNPAYLITTNKGKTVDAFNFMANCLRTLKNQKEDYQVTGECVSLRMFEKGALNQLNEWGLIK